MHSLKHSPTCHPIQLIHQSSSMHVHTTVKAQSKVTKIKIKFLENTDTSHTEVQANTCWEGYEKDCVEDEERKLLQAVGGS